MSDKVKRSEAFIPDDLLAAMLMALPAAAPSSRRQTAMKKSLLSRIDSMVSKKATEKVPELLLIRADEGRWFNFAPSVDMKVLHDDGATRTWLARFGAGGCVPAHTQTGDEEAIVIEGWCYLDDLKINSGDYHLIRKGARHGNIRSPDGCLIFVRSHSLTRHASQLSAAH